MEGGGEKENEKNRPCGSSGLIQRTSLFPSRAHLPYQLAQIQGSCVHAFVTQLPVCHMYLQFWLRHHPWSRPSNQMNCPALAKFRPLVLIISSWQLISVLRTINFCCPFYSNCAAAHQQRWASAHCRLTPSEFKGCHQLLSRHILLPSHRIPNWVGRARGRCLAIQCIQMYIPCPWKFMRPVLLHNLRAKCSPWMRVSESKCTQWGAPHAFQRLNLALQPSSRTRGNTHQYIFPNPASKRKHLSKK